MSTIKIKQLTNIKTSTVNTAKHIEQIIEEKGIWVPVMKSPQGPVELNPILPHDYLSYDSYKKQLYQYFEQLNLIYYKKI